MNILQKDTKQKNAENALRETIQELEQFKYALDQSAIVAITDTRGVIEYVNDTFIEISKYERNELIGKTHRVINSGYHPKEFFANVWNTILAGKIWRGEIRNRAKDGKYYWVDTTITPLLGEDGLPKRFIAIRYEITKRKELEQQKDEFLSIASHELKTPLTSIKAFTQLLARRFADSHDTRMKHHINRMEIQLTKLTDLVSELLDVTRIKSGVLEMRPEEFILDDFVREIVSDIQSISQSPITFQNGGDKKTVIADKTRLSQVLTNLIMNAVKYSKDKKVIIVRISAERDFAAVHVVDFGIGIPEDQHDKIFSRFFRINDPKTEMLPGMGLGLYISKEIITRLGGQIWVESTPGKGSTFGFTIPLAGKIPNNKSQISNKHQYSITN